MQLPGGRGGQGLCIAISAHRTGAIDVLGDVAQDRRVATRGQASRPLAAMTAEIAIRELDAGRRLPAERRSLRRFLGAAQL